MSKSLSWQRYQDWFYFHPQLELYLDLSRMRLDPYLEGRLSDCFERAFRDMDALEKGALANIDEGRRVGHFWLREPDLAPDPSIREAIRAGIGQVDAFVKDLLAGALRPPRASRFTHLLSIGIGGSALGPQFIAEALAPHEPPIAVHFLDNTDPAGFDRVLARLEDCLDSTLVLEITKSGSTPEPRNALAEVRHLFERKGLHLPSQAVAITSPGSQMDRVAESEGWLARFALHDWIGGRTSVMSPVGLLPAALLGIDIKALLEGARIMDIATRVPSVRNNPAALLALAWWGSGDGRGVKDMVVLPYKDSLLLLSRYLQQLIMESLGKEKDLDGNTVHQGLAVYGNKGSTDQHAFVQQLREGIPNFFVNFIEVLEDRKGPSIEVEPGITSGDYLSGFLQGTRKALYDNGRDSITVTITQVNPLSLGALIALYERAVGLYASLIHVNAYHQPGVEAGKAAAAAVLGLQRRIVDALERASEPLDLETLADLAGAPDATESVYLIVRHLAANRRGVVLLGEPGSPSSLRVGRG